eukprot:UN02455
MISIAMWFMFYIFLEYYQYVHLYIISDNRHYTFYLWRKILKYPLYRCLLSICCVPCTWILNNLIKTQNFLWKFTYILCCFLNFGLSPLIEFHR